MNKLLLKNESFELFIRKIENRNTKSWINELFKIFRTKIEKNKYKFIKNLLKNELLVTFITKTVKRNPK